MSNEIQDRARPYQLLEVTVGLCPACRTRVDAKIVERDGRVYILRHCPEHGAREDILEDDAAYYRRRLEYDKPGTQSKTQTCVEKGCPFDCGLCPTHEQHTCIGLIEITQRCSLSCPACYACSPGPDLLLEEVERMMDFYQDAEGGQAEVLQISGGEPSEHAGVLDILRLAKTKQFKYVMLNTNGLRIAEDEAFARELAGLVPGFEVYLQFDGMEEASSVALRGEALVARKRAAVERLDALGVPVTLVTMVQAGVNDHELGELIRYGLGQDCVRGVNLQPVAYFTGSDDEAVRNRITLTGILDRVEAQTGGDVRKADFIPLPCDVDRVAITYLYRSGERFVPITRRVDFRPFLPQLPNTFAFDADQVSAAACSGSCDCAGRLLSSLQPLIPAGHAERSTEEKVDHFNRNVFRLSVSSFLDPFNFDMRSMQKECVHVITPDLRRVPFSAYNMFHRAAQ